MGYGGTCDTYDIWSVDWWMTLPVALMFQEENGNNGSGSMERKTRLLDDSKVRIEYENGFDLRLWKMELKLITGYEPKSVYLD